MKVFEIQNGFGLDNLTMVDRDQPTPGPGQVLIKLKAWSLNYRDLMMTTGTYNPRLRFPFVPLSDGAGEIVSTGEGVSRAKAGDRVCPLFMPKWIEGEPNIEKGKSSFGGGGEGVLQEYVVLGEESVVRLPEHLSYEEGAALPCAAVTAWHALISEGGLNPGDTVLLQGTGGVSIFALQFATMVGAHVIITSSSNEKLERAKALGAAELVNYKENPDWDRRVIELTGVGVDHIVEVGGAGTLNKSLKAVRMGGTISVIGALAGGSGDISTVLILMKNIRLQGIFVGSRDMFEAMNRAISERKMKPVIDRVFPFDQARDALKYMSAGQHFGKICITA